MVGNEDDSRGKILERAFYGIDGTPCVSLMLGFHKMKDLYDSNGYILETACYGADGAPCLGEHGCHKEIYVRDSKGNLLEHKILDAEGNIIE